MVSSEPDFRSLQVLFYAFLTGLLIFMFVIIFLILEAPGVEQYLLGPGKDLLLTGLYALTTIAISRFIDRMRQRQIPAMQRVAHPDFAHYRSTVILRLALLEGAGLLTILLAFVTRNLQLFTVTALVLMAFWLARPREEEFRERYS